MTYTLTKYYDVLENGEKEIYYLIFSENEDDILKKLTDYLDEYGLRIMLDLMDFKIGDKISELRDGNDLFFESFSLKRWNGEDYYP